MDRSFRLLAAFSLLALFGCCSNAQARQCPVSPADPVSGDAPPIPSSGDTTEPPVVKVPNAPSATAEASSNSTSESPEPAESLPELKLKLTGMHIGGGPNDAESKQPFIEAIEAGFEQMRVCYQKADEPTKGGTYGVDLRIEREGGRPTIQAVRTVMKGDAMRACLEQAFVGLNFAKPVKGPTVLSASVYFELTP